MNTATGNEPGIWRRLVTDILRGQIPTDAAQAGYEPAGLIGFLDRHGLGPLVLDALEQADRTGVLARDVIETLEDRRRSGAMLEVCRTRHLSHVLEAFEDHGIDCLLLKGAALAYTVYARPDLRPRIDADLLIDPSDKQAADQILTGLGLEKANTVSGELISRQAMYSVTERDIRHTYDLHWSLSNSLVYARLFDLVPLFDRSVAIEMPGCSARGLEPVDALLHAVVHYFGHLSHERDRLIWIYDLHLLASSLDPPGWRSLVRRANTLGLGPHCKRALELCRTTFGTRLPTRDPATFTPPHGGLDKLERRRISGASWGRQEQFRSDWGALDTGQRVRLAREYLIPSADFVLGQNRSSSRLLLPYFYLKRGILGVLSVLGLNARPGKRD